ncbi:MAG: NAD(P)H-hydrate dehydratase [Microbacterium sp.]
MPGGRAREPQEWGAADARGVLRVPTASDHKYSRGVVSLRTGSESYPGAAVLSVEGATRAGVGMVRWDGPSSVAALVLQRRPETVIGTGRTTAWVIGSGMDARARTDAEAAILHDILSGTEPAVVDAGALDLAASAACPVIVTPHDGELREVRIPLGFGIDDVDEAPLNERLASGFAERALVARETAVALGAVVLLKGASTIVATPGGWWTVVRSGTPWLATAGSGDVLAGVIGAVLAGAQAESVEDLGPVAATGAWLHGAAARLAAGASSASIGHPITAIDVAGHLPAAFALAQAN